MEGDITGVQADPIVRDARIIKLGSLILFISDPAEIGTSKIVGKGQANNCSVRGFCRIISVVGASAGVVVGSDKISRLALAR